MSVLRPSPSIVIAGRICIDLYPDEVGKSLQEVDGFTKTIGGSATNVAVACARLGHHVALVSRTGDDPFGLYAVDQLRQFGVDARYITPVAGMQSVLTFCEMYPPDDFPLFIWRNPTAPDMYLSSDDMPLGEIADADVYWSTATGLSREPSRAAHYEAWASRSRVPNTVLDLDYRDMFWENEEHASSTISAALEHVTVAVGNREECRIAVGEVDPHRAADALLDRGVELAIVKQGPRGVLARTRTETVEVAPLPVEVMNGLGAGDAFGGALCHGLIEGWPLERMLRYANAAGALVATRATCSTAMPTPDEVDRLLEGVVSR